MKTLAPSNASWRSFAVGLLAMFFVLTQFALHFHCRGDALCHLAVIAAMLIYLADIFLLVLCLKRVSGRYSRMFMGS